MKGPPFDETEGTMTKTAKRRTKIQTMGAARTVIQVLNLHWEQLFLGKGS